MARTPAAGSKARVDPIRIRFAAFELDEANASLLRDREPVPLAPTPFAVLCALVRKRGSLLTSNELLDEVWGHQFVSDSVLRTAISELRTALDDDARQPRFIQTVSRRGYRFIAEADEIAAAPVQSSVSVAPALDDASFVGRSEALSQLRRAWEAACSGKRQIVWVAGEAGIGKTTLIEHFIAGLGNVTCARGQCVEHYGTGEPYLPVLEAISELCRIDGTLVPLLRSVAPTWLLQLPWFTNMEERESLRRELAGVSSERMLREIGALLDRSADRQPLLLVTEDLHWSDRATIQLIDYVARRRVNARLMWLATFRLAEVVALDHPLNRLRRELRIHDLCDEIVLDSFSESEVAEYVVKRTPSIAFDEAFVRALHERTDGVPLFVASVVSEMRSRAAEGGVVAAEQVAKMAVPENLAAIIEHYIATLNGEQRALLSTAAAYGVEFHVKTIAAVLERDVASVSDVCAQLARERLWLIAPDGERRTDEVPTYSFRHALFRQVVYECTTPSARGQLHRKLGAVLERERATGAAVTAAELATHFERGGEPAGAVRYYTEAAEGALSHFAPQECLAIVERASHLLEEVAEGPLRNSLQIGIDTLHGLAATRVLGAGIEAKSAFQRAYSRLGDDEHPMRARLMHGFGFMLCLRAEYAEALAVADRAEALGSSTNDPALLSTACTVHGQVDQLQGRSRAAREWLERGLVAAERLDSGPGEFLVDPQVALLALLAVPLLHLGLVTQGRSCLARAHDRARARGWPMARLVAMWYSALFEVRLGNTERVSDLADEMRALVDEFALAHGQAACRWYRGWADARRGQPREGYRAIREAYEDNMRLGMVVGASEILGYATEALVLAGDLVAAEAQLEEALAIASGVNERVYLPQLYLMQASIACKRGDHAFCEASQRQALEEARSQQAPWLELMARNALHDDALASADDREALAMIVDGMPEASDTDAIGKARRLLAK
jgi:DNA-binding winged helix-turn-helix (wHTH) protein